jgi:hypothetical protein
VRSYRKANHLAGTVANLGSVPDFSEATKKYVDNVGKLSEVLENMYEASFAFLRNLGSMDSLISVSQDTQNYHVPVVSKILQKP